MTNEIQNVDNTYGLAVNLFVLADPTKYTLVESKVVGESGRETLYERNDADPARPVHLRIGSYPAKDGKYNTSIREEFWNKYTDDDGEITYELDSCVIAFTTQRQPFFDALEGMWGCFTNTASHLLGATASGVPDYDGFSRLSRGITDLNYGSITRT